MIKKVQPDFVLLFQTPIPDESLSIAFWNYGEGANDPVPFKTDIMEALADRWVQKGYKPFASKDSEFKAWVLVRKDIDAARAVKSAKEFLRVMAKELASKLGLSLDGELKQ